MKIRHVALALAVSGLVAAPALAGTVYRWQTEEGTYAYTDDAKRIPGRYKDAAEKVRTGNLANYERHTPSRYSAGGAYDKDLKERLARLRAADTGPDAPSVRRDPARVRVLVGSGGGGHRGGGGGAAVVGVSAGGDGEGPVVVKNFRARPQGSIATRHITVVERNGEPLAIIKGELNQTGLQNIPRETGVFAD